MDVYYIYRNGEEEEEERWFRTNEGIKHNTETSKGGPWTI